MSKISVIIPVYNVEKYLRECLDSVINQTLTDIEIICINDGSTDSSLDILNEYAQKDERIQIINQENKGAGVARNTGIDVATGDYLSILDSDDIFEPNMLEKLYNKSIATNSDIVICRCWNLDSKTNQLENIEYSLEKKYIPPKEVFNYKDIPKHIYGLCIGWSWDKLYKREFVLKHNLRFQNLRSTNDMFFVFYSLVLAERISVIDDYLIKHRINTNTQLSETRDKDPLCFILAIKKLYKALNYSGIYKEVEQSFYNWMIEFSFWHMDTLSDEENVKLLKKKLCKTVFPMLKARKRKINFYYNQSTYDRVYKLLGPTLLQQIFSVTNQNNHKVITILGIKIKINRNLDKKYNTKAFIRHTIENKSVLLVEMQQCHGECIIGMAKYFIELGYNVDVILNNLEAKLNPFSDYKSNNINIFSLPPNMIKDLLCSDIVERYDHLYFNSDRFAEQSICEYLGQDIKYPAGKTITMCHHAEKFDDIDFNTKNSVILTLAKLPILDNKCYKVVNTHFYKNIKKHNKNQITQFVVVGNIEAFRKNHNLLIDVVQELSINNEKPFKIIVISRFGEFLIPQKLKQYFEFKSKLPYKDMYYEIENADFLLTLFDVDNEAHDRYIYSGVSGSYQLSYGFNIPVVIPYKFQTEINGFNESNSIGYKNNSTLKDAMKFCIEMKQDEYNKYKLNLQELEKSIHDTSINNLRSILEKKVYNFENNIFVSLGENCFNRVVLTRHELKNRKSQGEKSLPFDLCVCPLKTVAKCLSNDFEMYFKDIKWDNKNYLWKNDTLNISYNHDIDCFKNDKKKLIDRYKKRIDNLRNLLTDTKEKIFIISIIESNTNDYVYINKIYNVLQEKCHCKYKLAVIILAKQNKCDINLLNKNIYYKHIPHPYPNYWGEWFKGEFFNSAEGKIFEQKYIDFILSVNKSNKDFL